MEIDDMIGYVKSMKYKLGWKFTYVVNEPKDAPPSITVTASWLNYRCSRMISTYVDDWHLLKELHNLVMQFEYPRFGEYAEGIVDSQLIFHGMYYPDILKSVMSEIKSKDKKNEPETCC